MGYREIRNSLSKFGWLQQNLHKCYLVRRYHHKNSLRGLFVTRRYSESSWHVSSFEREMTTEPSIFSTQQKFETRKTTSVLKQDPNTFLQTTQVNPKQTSDLASDLIFHRFFFCFFFYRLTVVLFKCRFVV